MQHIYLVTYETEPELENATGQYSSEYRHYMSYHSSFEEAKGRIEDEKEDMREASWHDTLGLCSFTLNVYQIDLGTHYNDYGDYLLLYQEHYDEGWSDDEEGEGSIWIRTVIEV